MPYLLPGTVTITSFSLYPRTTLHKQSKDTFASNLENDFQQSTHGFPLQSSSCYVRFLYIYIFLLYFHNLSVFASYISRCSISFFHIPSVSHLLKYVFRKPIYSLTLYEIHFPSGGVFHLILRISQYSIISNMTSNFRLMTNHINATGSLPPGGKSFHPVRASSLSRND